MGGVKSREMEAAIHLDGYFDRKVTVDNSTSYSYGLGLWRPTRLILECTQLGYFELDDLERSHLYTTVEKFDLQAEDLLTLQFTLRVQDWQLGESIWTLSSPNKR